MAAKKKSEGGTRKSKFDGNDGKETRVYSFRLPVAVADAWDSKISRSNMTKSDFMRTAVIENETVINGDASAKRKRPVRIAGNVHPDIVRRNFLLAQASQNINQIAKRLNSDNLAGLVTPATYATISQELLNISTLMKGHF